MPRRQVKQGHRQFCPEKPFIRLFYEGESEQMYAEYLKKQFKGVAVICIAERSGLFSYAKDKFEKDAKYRNSVDVLDEIWFFFDVEVKDRDKWDERWKIIRKLRRLRRKPGVRVRLLMTTACIEYWLLLHYRLTAPAPLITPEDKDHILNQLQGIVPEYQKGDRVSTWKIAAEYPKAVRHGGQVLTALQSDGLPGLEDTDVRNRWLCQCGKTFTTVQEAILFLEGLSH